MRRFRFHIGSIVILILLLGVCFAALRESNQAWDSSIFSITLCVLLISILLAIHRTEKRRAFWLGFALFGTAYLGISLVPSIESRLITTKALAYLDSKVPRSIPAGVVYFDYDNDGDMDLFVVNNSQPNTVFLKKGNGTIYNVTAMAGWKGLIGTTEHFVRIGHSLLAVVAALLGGQRSRYLHTKNPQGTSGPVPAPVSISDDSGVRESTVPATFSE